MKTVFPYTPSQVLHIYAGHNGGDAHTRALIAMALREGRLLIRTSHRWTSDEPSIIKAWKTEPKLNNAQKPPRKIVRRGLWWRSVCWNSDILDWDFKRSRMMVTISLDPFERVMLKGVRFKSDQIKAILAPGALSLKAGSTEKVTEKDMWRRFWHDVIVLAAGSKGGVKDTELARFRSGDALTDHIFDNLLQEDEKLLGNVGDEEIAQALADRHPFGLGRDAVLKEVKELRRAFNLRTWGQGTNATTD